MRYKNRNYAVPHPTIKVKCAVRCGKFLPIMRQMCGDFSKFVRKLCGFILHFLKDFGNSKRITAALIKNRSVYVLLRV